VGAGGYLVLFIRLHDYFLEIGSKESEFTSRSHLVGDEGVNRLTDPQFYLKIAQEQYELLAHYLTTHKQSKNCFSYFMSEVAVWVHGMHIAFRSRNVPLFRQN
jgi:hypothetical protein